MIFIIFIPYDSQHLVELRPIHLQNKRYKTLLILLTLKLLTK